MPASTHLSILETDNGSTVLINSLTGAVDVVDPELKSVIRRLLSDHPADGQEELAAALRRRGHLFDDGRSERELVGKIKDAASRMLRSSGTKIVICPTLRCNFGCVYCFEDDEIKDRPGLMTVAMVDQIFDQAFPDIDGRAGAGRPQISLFGGEPLLPSTRPVVERILHRAEQLDLKVSATTNGSHIVYFGDLLERHAGIVESMQITLDGVERVHNVRRAYAAGKGSFSDVVAGIECALANNVSVGMRVNLDGQNIDNLPELADLVMARGWHENPLFAADVAPVTDHLCQGTVPNILKEDELVRRLLPLMDREPKLRRVFGFRTFRVLNHLISVLEGRKDLSVFTNFYFCEANRMGFFVFCPDGFVYPCPEAVGDRSIAIGSFWPTYQLNETAFEGWQDRTTESVPKCRSCAISGFCGGGCAYAALKVNGSVDDPVCGQAHEVVRSYIEHKQARLVTGDSTGS